MGAIAAGAAVGLLILVIAPINKSRYGEEAEVDIDGERVHWHGVRARDTAAQLVGSSVVGVSTGLVVLALEHIVEDVLHEIFEAPVWVPAVAVVIGALATAILI